MNDSNYIACAYNENNIKLNNNRTKETTIRK